LDCIFAQGGNDASIRRGGGYTQTRTEMGGEPRDDEDDVYEQDAPLVSGSSSRREGRGEPSSSNSMVRRALLSVREALVAFVWGVGEHCADVLGLNDMYFNASVVDYLESLEAEERAYKVQRKERRLERMREEEDLVALEERPVAVPDDGR